MSVVTFRRKVVPPSSGRQILFHTDAKVGGKKGFRPSNGAQVRNVDNVLNTVCNNTFFEDRQGVHAFGRLAVGILTSYARCFIMFRTQSVISFSNIRRTPIWN
jgi:hypothetical protein